MLSVILSIFKTYFSTIQLVLLSCALISLLFSFIFFQQDKERMNMFFLFLTAFCTFSFAALLDPFLNLWDERFHALVAKHLIQHPLFPTLYEDTSMLMQYDRWDRFHIWLHKQPLFLWQIALSFKLFGLNEFALRLPNVILGSITTLGIYRMGKLLFQKQVGFIAAVLFISSLFAIELIAGRQEVDQNDFSFMAYIGLSIWSLVEYQYSKKKFWLLLLGLFAGFAVLCKWLVGLLVYAGWAFLNVQEKQWSWSNWSKLLVTLGLSLLIFIPWQIYSWVHYPAEFLFEMNYNSAHILNAVEGHSGHIFYHFLKLPMLYGTTPSYFLLPSLFFFHKYCTDKKLSMALILMMISVFIFFSLVATKMPAFTFIISPLLFISLACFFYQLFEWGTKIIRSKELKTFILGCSIFLLIVLRFDIEGLQAKHTLWKKGNQYSFFLSNNKSIFKKLDLPENTILCNVLGRHYIEAMFYTPYPAYNFIPSKIQYDNLKKQGKHIAIFVTPNLEIDHYLKNDTSIIYIPDRLYGYE